MEANKRNINSITTSKKNDASTNATSDSKNLKRSFDNGSMESEQEKSNENSSPTEQPANNESAKSEQSENKKMCTFSTILTNVKNEKNEVEASEMMDCPMGKFEAPYGEFFFSIRIFFLICLSRNGSTNIK